ncbi:hypothetical protein TNCV_2448931 [Trichonephila clavipes]|uniref:Uncharacterized protein n=1 Tax=Trichonephila clavipes TaxID=2585209 RepID=A0A8X6SP90_TRICX|nr:hypothetical protein TNCV_2448931 [Trichonephila clavipes]
MIEYTEAGSRNFKKVLTLTFLISCSLLDQHPVLTISVVAERLDSPQQPFRTVFGNYSFCGSIRDGYHTLKENLNDRAPYAHLCICGTKSNPSLTE